MAATAPLARESSLPHSAIVRHRRAVDRHKRASAQRRVRGRREPRAVARARRAGVLVGQQSLLLGLVAIAWPAAPARAGDPIAQRSHALAREEGRVRGGIRALCVFVDALSELGATRRHCALGPSGQAAEAAAAAARGLPEGRRPSRRAGGGVVVLLALVAGADEWQLVLRRSDVARGVERADADRARACAGQAR
jgi:hypothetical protein